MTASRFTYHVLLPLVLILCVNSSAWAQRFSVVSFKMLPNDVSAFINPVRDLNDEDCALVKVIASEDFAFSTPLGIVKRIDKTGEIWLYLPRGSKKITIKHPTWGVLRDYAFPGKVVSHMAYELRIEEPVAPITMSNVPAEVKVVRDTLVLTRVDTLVVRPPVKYVPFNLETVATISYGGRNGNILGGLLLMAMKRHGGFVHVASDFSKIGPVRGECGITGETAGSTPFYTGRTRSSSFMINAGMAHRITKNLSVYEGAGYSSSSLAWQLAPSEGGGYLKNSHYSLKGISFEAGVSLVVGRIAISSSVTTVKGKDWYGSVGAGIKFGK
ncbi:hypothetical protein [Muribaculum intestinale]|nr:hypothetical protein [Muribaculum intestinale]MYM11042.1 hypothetical protein [Muribaculum intestinale]